jgi:hypothetical protein
VALLSLPGQNVPDVVDAGGNGPSPAAELAAAVDGLYPLIKILVFGATFVGLLALRFEDESNAVCQANEEVGAILANHSAENVVNLEAEMIVLDPKDKDSPVNGTTATDFRLMSDS